MRQRRWLDAGKCRRLLADRHQELRDRTRLPQLRTAVVILPAERHDPPLAKKSVKLELLERQVLNVFDQALFFALRHEVGLVPKAVRHCIGGQCISRWCSVGQYIGGFKQVELAYGTCRSEILFAGQALSRRLRG